MRASVALGLLVPVAAVAACDRPSALVICHNANCAEPADPDRDDTLAAMRESLALQHAGRPAIDGIELDSFWRGSDGVCLYAHDLANLQESTLAIEPAMELALHFATPGPITFADGTTFQVLLELKSHVSASTTDRHTPEQRNLHAQCAWQIYTIISDAAVLASRDVELVFSAFAPELLTAVLDPANQPAATPTPFKLGAVQGVPAPLDDQTRPLSDYHGLPLGELEFHAQWFLDAQYEAFASYRSAAAEAPTPRDVDLVFFMFSATVETFAVIEQYEPRTIVTSEARLFRRWLEN